MTHADKSITPRPVLNEHEKLLNRVKRVTDLIEANGKLATPGPWSVSHSHVIKHQSLPPAEGHRWGKDASFDVASQPYKRDQACFGINPTGDGYPDMRYIATCNPQTMLNLVEDVRKLARKATLLDELVKLDGLSGLPMGMRERIEEECHVGD